MDGRVLVVDDEASLLDFFAEVLAESGHSVATAPNATTALELLSREEFDAVVSDIMMPGLTGIGLLRVARGRDPDLPVVLVTGSPTLETALEALEHGALQYLVKPITPDALQNAVARALRLRRMAKLRREALGYLRSHGLPEVDRDTLAATFARATAALWMAYQPILRARDGQLFGYEALARTDEETFKNPAKFFGAAESLGRVTELGRCVRQSVAVRLAEGQLEGSIFVNLHAEELTDEALLSPDGVLARHARRVVLEITERASIEAIPDARSRIRTLRDLGFRVAVDDLGAGYAGLASFAALEPDVVKLDIALVRGCHQEAVKRKLIGSMTALCRDLGILVVAEGIEESGEARVLIDLGCDLLQGFLFARPSREPQRLTLDPAVWPASTG
jgi:EAL domain-containing protein (putative c-di-GMP-specific phosphodiesterase class I)